MSFDWSEYLALALELAPLPIGLSISEAKLRSAVSRAYYATHCKARNQLRDKENVLLPRTDVHKFVIEHFLNSSNRMRKDLGKDLNRLKVDRLRADYEDEFHGLVPATEVALRRAQQILVKLDQLSSS